MHPTKVSNKYTESIAFVSYTYLVMYKKVVTFENQCELPLLQLKIRGALVKPNNDIFWVVQVTNQVLDHMLNSCNVFIERNIVEKVLIRVKTYLTEKKPNIFKNYKIIMYLLEIY